MNTKVRRNTLMYTDISACCTGSMYKFISTTRSANHDEHTSCKIILCAC